MAASECVFRGCPHHEAERLPTDVAGPLCDNDECAATPEASDEYARRRTLILARLQFLVPREETGGGLWWP